MKKGLVIAGVCLQLAIGVGNTIKAFKAIGHGTKKAAVKVIRHQK